MHIVQIPQQKPQITSLFNFKHQSQQQSIAFFTEKITSKRESYRIQIRKAQNKLKFKERRQILSQLLKNMDYQLLKFLKEQHKKLSPQEIQQHILKLQIGFDDMDFYNKLIQLKLQSTLINYLKTINNIKTKISLTNTLNQILYFSDRSCQEFIKQELIDSLYKDFKNYTYADSESNSYLDCILTVVRNLTAILNIDFNRYLEDIGFCNFITQKIINQIPKQMRVDNLGKKLKELMKIRTNIIITLGNKKQKFLFQTMQQIYREILPFKSQPKQYMNLLNAILKIPNNNQNYQSQLKQKISLINGIYWQNIVAAQDFIQLCLENDSQFNYELTLLILKCLNILYDTYGQQTINYNFNLSIRFMRTCLLSNDKQIKRKILKFLVNSLVTRHWYQIFPQDKIPRQGQTEEDRMNLWQLSIKLAINQLNNLQLQNYSLITLKNFTQQFQHIQFCISHKIFQKIQQIIQINYVNIYDLINILQLLEKLIEYTVKKDKQDFWILNVLESRGVFSIIQNFQFHDNIQLRALATKIYEKYGKRVKDTNNESEKS